MGKKNEDLLHNRDALLEEQAMLEEALSDASGKKKEVLEHSLQEVKDTLEFRTVEKQQEAYLAAKESGTFSGTFDEFIERISDNEIEQEEETLDFSHYPDYFQETVKEYADQHPQLASFLRENVSYDETNDAFKREGVGYLLGQKSEFRSNWNDAPAKLPEGYQLPVGVNPKEEGGNWNDLYTGTSTFGTMIDKLPIEDSQQAGIIFAQLMGMTGKWYWTDKKYSSSCAVRCNFGSDGWSRHLYHVGDGSYHVRGFRPLT